MCPLSQERVFSAEAVKNTLSVMFTCGLGVESGDFSYSVGVPAKTNKCGAMMIIVPGVFGAAFYSPPINANLQPLRAWHFARSAADKWCVHRYRQVSTGTDLYDMKLYDGNKLRTAINDLLNASLGGDLVGVKSLHHRGISLDSCDYDGRSAAHLAAAGGRLNVLEYLHANGADMKVQDRWGCTPLQDAQKVGDVPCTSFLEKYLLMGTR